MKPFNQRGQAAMLLVMFIAVVALITIASVVFRSTVTSRNSVRAGKSITAYEIANAAAQKGIWALNLNTDNWKTVGDGGTISGYDGTATYTDIPGGAYKLRVYAGAGTDERVVEAMAKDVNPNPQYRGLRVTLTKGGQFGPVMGYKINFKKRAKVHWGPIYAYDELKLEGKSKVYYPQLFSKGAITHLDTNSALPNTDGVRWWSFNYAPGVPEWPQIDFEYYKGLAKLQGNYYAKGDRSKGKKHKDDDSDKLDDHDRDDDDEYSYANVIDTQPYVRFYDTGVKAKFKGGKNLLRGVIIAMDKIEFKNGTASVADVNVKYSSCGLSAYYPRALSIPKNAWKQYQKLDTSASGDYPGDTGGPGSSGQAAAYTFGASFTDATHTPSPIHVEGFLYSGSQIKFHKGGVVAGVVMSAHKTTKLEDAGSDDDQGDGDYDKDHNEDSGHDPKAYRDHTNDWSATGRKKHLSIFFQDNLGIRIIGSGAKQTAWEEFAPTPF